MKFWPLGSRAWISAFLFFFTLVCSAALVGADPDRQAARTDRGRHRRGHSWGQHHGQKFQWACDLGHLRWRRRV